MTAVTGGSASGAAAAPGGPPARAPAGWRGPAAIVAIVLAAAAAYANTLSVPFVFDDHSAILLASNVHALALTPAALSPALEGFPAGRWLATLSFAVNHALGGVAPAGYHAVNLAFHAASGALVLLLAREIFLRLGGLAGPARRRAALVAALLFVLHPVQTQAVTYVVQRMTSMGAFFGLLALLSWVRGRAREGAARALRLCAAGISAYLAFACKETYAVLPLLALLLEALLFPGLLARARRHPLLAGGGALALAGLALLLGLRYWGVVAAELPRYPFTTGERLLTQPRVLWLYLSLLALPLPSRLHLDYAFEASTGLLSPPTTLAALAALAALVALAFAARRRVPLAWLALAWFLLSLSIEQTALPIHLVFEHRLYLPSLGIFVLAAWSLERLLARAERWRWLVVGPVLASLGFATVVRNADWRDPARLYADAAGHGAGVAGNLVTLGQLLLERGQPREAEQALLRAQALDPADPGPLVNLGAAAARLGDLERSNALYRQALAMNPRIPQAWTGLAWNHYLVNRLDEAEDAARRGLALSPGFAPLRVPLSACLERRGDRAGAIRELEEALRADPGIWNAWLNLALLFLAEGRAEEALSAARRYAAAVPADPKGHAVAGRILLALGRRDEARAALTRALALDGADAGVRRDLAALDAPRPVRP